MRALPGDVLAVFCSHNIYTKRAHSEVTETSEKLFPKKSLSGCNLSGPNYRIDFMMHDLIEDYLETWTIVRGRIKKRTRARRFLFKDPSDYKEWLNSVTNHAIADALAHRDKWDRKYPFHSFVFLRARDLVRKELSAESKFFQAQQQANRVAESHQPYQEDPWEEFLESKSIDTYLGQLSDDQVEVISLHYRCDLSVKETARLMERTDGSVKTLLHRARSKLLDLLVTSDPGVYGRLSSAMVEPPPTNVISLPMRRQMT